MEFQSAIQALRARAPGSVWQGLGWYDITDTSTRPFSWVLNEGRSPWELSYSLFCCTQQKWLVSPFCSCLCLQTPVLERGKIQGAKHYGPIHQPMRHPLKKNIKCPSSSLRFFWVQDSGGIKGKRCCLCTSQNRLGPPERVHGYIKSISEKKTALRTY